ncbi:MAG: glycosyltransferase family 1 protein [Microbacteriaceae bacterium]|nr:glycosyltransferase family 1 protein [Microbacteriaceae bacterium]
MARLPQPKVLLGVTSDKSFRLLEGFPQYLVSRGWDVHLVSSPGTALARLGALEGISSHPIPMKREPALLDDFVSLCRWVRLLLRVRPNLMSVGTPKAGLLGSIAGSVTRVPRRIYLLRGLRLETTAGILFVILRFAEKIAVLSSHQVLAVSESLRAKAIQLKIVKADKVTVLGRGSSNGVDIEQFRLASLDRSGLEALASTLGLDSATPVVGFVGRLTKDKGLDVLRAARELLQARGIDHQLLVIGTVERGGQLPAVGATGMLSGGRPPVFTGQVDNPETYFQLMDVLCLPTFREGFPNVVLEAAASHVPTVTTTATGAIDSVLDGITGFVAQLGSAESLSENLAKILLDQNLRSRMGDAAFDFAQDHYSRDRVWELTEAHFRKLLGRPPRSLLSNW